MDDYKELIAKFRAKKNDGWQKDGSYQEQIITVQDILDAEDAIERLVKERNRLELQNHLERCEHAHTRKERDAAVDDLMRNKTCSVCSNNKNIEICRECLRIDLLAGQTVHKMWQWRGAREDTDEIDRC